MTIAQTRPEEPPVILDASRLDLLQSLASGALRRAPELADRLLHEIVRAEVLPPEQMPGDVVNIGSEITYRDETTGREQTITLVLPEDADIAARRASVLTPIGAALIGLREGATIEWETRGHETRHLTILSVRNSRPDEVPTHN